MPRGKQVKPGEPVLPEPSALKLAAFLAYGQADATRVDQWDFAPELIRDVVLAALSAGCAIQFGMNRERTAVAVSVYDNGVRTPLGYHNDAEQLGDMLEGLKQSMRLYADAQRKQPGIGR